MDVKVKVWLLDIQKSIDEIFEFLEEGRTFSSYR